MDDKEIAKCLARAIHNLSHNIVRLSLANAFAKFKRGEPLTSTEVELLESVSWLFDENELNMLRECKKNLKG